LTHTVEES